MVKAKERFEILLEDVRDKINIVVEGHAALNDKFDRLKEEMTAKHSGFNRKLKLVHFSLKNEIKAASCALMDEIKTVKEDVKRVDEKVEITDKKVEKIDYNLNRVEGKLDEHMRMPAHVGAL